MLGYFTLLVSAFLISQGTFTLYWMLYAWQDPKEIKKNRLPKVFLAPKYRFSILVPAREEEQVIKATIISLSKLNYPEHLVQFLIICHETDPTTILASLRAINELALQNFELISYSDQHKSKPAALNFALKHTNGDIVGVFDAEDEPHPEILNIINTVFVKDSPDVVQSGVQLTNYESNWFSVLNVLEYFFWFKSALHFFAKCGATPLGGNTVFFQKEMLQVVGGWDPYCLTEDADIGIRLSSIGAKTRVVYDERYVTREETPTSVAEFIRQRTRWNTGFLQIFLKGDWVNLRSKKQIVLTLYVLLSPITQSILLLYFPLGILMTLTNFEFIPMSIALFSYIPLYLVIFQLVILEVGLFEFQKIYKTGYSFKAPIVLLLTFYIYQLMLMLAAARAVLRLIAKNVVWEKTIHINAHRSTV